MLHLCVSPNAAYFITVLGDIEYWIKLCINLRTHAGQTAEGVAAKNAAAAELANAFFKAGQANHLLSVFVKEVISPLASVIASSSSKRHNLEKRVLEAGNGLIAALGDDDVINAAGSEFRCAVRQVLKPFCDKCGVDCPLYLCKRITRPGKPGPQTENKNERCKIGNAIIAADALKKFLTAYLPGLDATSTNASRIKRSLDLLERINACLVVAAYIATHGKKDEAPSINRLLAESVYKIGAELDAAGPYLGDRHFKTFCRGKLIVLNAVPEWFRLV